MFTLSALLPSLYHHLLGAHLQPAARPVANGLDLSALVGALGWSRLPPAVKKRFASAHEEVTYEGRMDLHCSHIGRAYAIMARWVGGPLTTFNSCAVPTTVRVSDNGLGGIVWERCFHADSSARDCVVRSTKELGSDGGLLERTDGGLSMSLHVFEEAGALVFLSHRFWLVWGRFRLPVPALLTPGTCRVVHKDLGGGFFRFTLSMVHPLWGETFRQTGVFADPV
jgi:hypothetical protein